MRGKAKGLPDKAAPEQVSSADLALLDELAGRAMQAIIPMWFEDDYVHADDPTVPEGIGTMAYQLAAGMLKARKAMFQGKKS